MKFRNPLKRPSLKTATSAAIGEGVGYFAGVPFVGTAAGGAAGFTIDFLQQELHETAEITLMSKEPRYGKFLHQDSFFLEQFYSREKVIARCIPYSQVVSFLPILLQGLEPQIEITVDRGFFRLALFQDEMVNEVRGAAFSELRQKRVTRNSQVIRVNRVDMGDTKVVLHVQRTDYFEQAKSNLIVDYETSEGVSIRKVLNHSTPGALVPLNDDRLANSLGIAICLFYSDRGKLTPLIVPRSKDVAVFNRGEWHCSASGAAEWPQDQDNTPMTFEDYILDDLYREIEEELGIRKNEVADVVPLAFCREFLRAGKPQMFFFGYTKLTYPEIVERMGKAREVARSKVDEPREIMRMPLFRFPEQFKDVETLRRAYEGSSFTPEGAANLFYAMKLLEGGYQPPLCK